MSKTVFVGAIQTQNITDEHIYKILGINHKDDGGMAIYFQNGMKDPTTWGIN